MPTNRLYKVQIDAKLPSKSPPRQSLAAQFCFPQRTAVTVVHSKKLQTKTSTEEPTKQTFSIPALDDLMVPPCPLCLSRSSPSSLLSLSSLCPCTWAAVSLLPPEPFPCSCFAANSLCSRMDVQLFVFCAHFLPLPSQQAALVPELLRLHHFPGITASQCSGRTVQSKLTFLQGCSSWEAP